MIRLDEELARAHWAHDSYARGGAHGLGDEDIEAALTFFTRAGEALPLQPPLSLHRAIRHDRDAGAGGGGIQTDPDPGDDDSGPSVAPTVAPAATGTVTTGVAPEVPAEDDSTMPFTPTATFNVKNLLEARDEGDRALLWRKLDGIAGMLRECDADVVGLQEVGPLALLDDVMARLPAMGYAAPVVGTPDARGIRCALLSRLPVLDARVETAAALPFPVFRVGDPAPFGTRIPLRRGLVRARVDTATGPVQILVVHFKSPLPVPLRDAAGVALEPTTAC